MTEHSVRCGNWEPLHELLQDDLFEHSVIAGGPAGLKPPGRRIPQLLGKDEWSIRGAQPAPPEPSVMVLCREPQLVEDRPLDLPILSSGGGGQFTK